MSHIKFNTRISHKRTKINLSLKNFISSLSKKTVCKYLLFKNQGAKNHWIFKSNKKKKDYSNAK